MKACFMERTKSHQKSLTAEHFLKKLTSQMTSTSMEFGGHVEIDGVSMPSLSEDNVIALHSTTKIQNVYQNLKTQIGL